MFQKFPHLMPQHECYPCTANVTPYCDTIIIG
jgi:hypothetical protein